MSTAARCTPSIRIGMRSDSAGSPSRPASFQKRRTRVRALPEASRGASSWRASRRRAGRRAGTRPRCRRRSRGAAGASGAASARPGRPASDGGAWSRARAAPAVHSVRNSSSASSVRLAALLEGHAERVELALEPADGGADDEPAARQHVHAREELGDGDGRAVGQDHHAGAQRDALGRRPPARAAWPAGRACRRGR